MVNFKSICFECLTFGAFWNSPSFCQLLSSSRRSQDQLYLSRKHWNKRWLYYSSWSWSNDQLPWKTCQKNQMQTYMIILGIGWPPLTRISILFGHSEKRQIFNFCLRPFMTILHFIHTCMYRTHATISRSWLVAASLYFQAKTHFLCDFFHAIIWRAKIQFLNCSSGY